MDLNNYFFASQYSSWNILLDRLKEFFVGQIMKMATIKVTTMKVTKMH